MTLYLPLPSFWAARVPNQVLSEDSYKRSIEAPNLNIAQRLKHFDYRQDWLRDFGSVYQKKINLMIAEWHELGIIAKADTNTQNAEGFLPDEVWKETGRKFGEHDPTFEQVITAETITHEDKPMLRKVATIHGEQTVKAKAASHSESSTRKRRSESRGER
jgi:hypothetical protein